MNFLFLNHKIKNCGVYQYGQRLYEIVKNEKSVYCEIENIHEYQNVQNVLDEKYIFIIYNFHTSTMSWLNKNNIQKKVKNIGRVHESLSDFFDKIIEIIPNQHEMSIPRPIFEKWNKVYNDFINYSEPGVPIFGSFGFAFQNKGFDKIISIINEQFDKAIIKFVIPGAYYQAHGVDINTTNSLVKNKLTSIHVKPDIKIMITHDFYSNDEILTFLESNTMNIFMYDSMNGRSISSVIDYAISVKKPIGISDSNMFRHIYSDTICLYKVSINECLKNSVNYFSRFLHEWSHKNMLLEFKKITSEGISQCLQDLFVIKVNKKTDGSFLEIGSNHPWINNNTYLLEKVYNWKGILVDYDTSFEELYKIHRKNSIYAINDATKIDYVSLLSSFPKNMDYLQIDLDVNNCSTLNTLNLLNNTVFNEYRFATITFEHDIYTGNYFDTREISRKILKDRGYFLLFADVNVFWEGSHKPFEDWYVHPDLVKPEILKIGGESLNYEQIKERLIIL